MTQLCCNMHCPARVSCALHYVRSPQYRQILQERTPMMCGFPDPAKGHCEAYRTDEPRAWLLPEDLSRACQAAEAFGGLVRGVKALRQ